MSSMCSCYTTIFPTPRVLLHLSVNFVQHSRATTGVPLPLHDTPSLTHLCSTIFFKLIPCALLILRYLRLRLQCPSRTLDLQYLTFPPHPHSTYLRFSLLDTATSAAKATPSVSGSTTPTSSLPRDPGGEAELQGQGTYIRQGLTLCSTRIAPTHIAFAADDRTQVRECYTNALKAGGRPSGAPSYRNNECSCFNAAVEDLDGNTIEFIFRENGPCHEEPSHADEEKSRVLTWQDGVAREADAASVASKAKSAAPTAEEPAPSVKAPSEAAPEEKAESVAEPAAEEAPASKGAGTFISSLSNGITTKGVLGGVIGAVAVGAIGYAFYQSEQDSARAEAAHEALMASYERGRGPSTRVSAYAPAAKRSMSAAPRSQYHRNYSTTESIGPPPRQHRNFSVTESRVGPRPPPTKVPTQAPTALRAIEAHAYDRDSEIQSVLSKHTSHYPQEMRMLEAGPANDDDEIKTVLTRHTSRHPAESRALDALTIDRRSEAPVPTVVSRATSHRTSSRALEAPASDLRSEAPAPTVVSRATSHRTSSRALDAASEVQPAMSTHTSRRSQALRALDADSEIAAATNRTTARRPQVARSQTFDASVYYPAPSSTAAGSRAPPKRSATLTDEPSAQSQLYIEGPKELVASSKSVRSGRDEDSESRVSHRSSRREEREDEDVKSQASTVRRVKRDGSRYDGSRAGGSRHEGSKHEGSRHGGSSYEGSKYEGSTYSSGSRQEGSRHGSSHGDGASRLGASRDPDTLSDASTIKASRRDSAAHIPTPASKAESKVSRTTAAEYRLPDSPVPSYYYPPSEQPKSATRAQSQVSAIRVPPSGSRAPSHAPSAQPSVAASRRGSQASASPSHVSRRPSHASGSAAGVPLPSSLASGRGYEDLEDDGLGDTKTVVPDDSISCIDLTQPKAPRSDYSRHSERSHRSHRTHHSSRSKHSHRHDDEKSRAPMDAQTVVPEDSISSVGSKPARSEHSHHSHRSDRDRKSHHSSRTKHSVSHDHAIGAILAQEKERELAQENIDARTVLPEDSISSVGARSEHSHHSHRSERDDKKSHHSSRSKHSKSHDDDKEKKKRKEGRTASEAGKSDVTVKPAKSMFSAMTLPARLRGGDKDKDKDEEKKKKRSVVSHA